MCVCKNYSFGYNLGANDLRAGPGTHWRNPGQTGIYPRIPSVGEHGKTAGNPQHGRLLHCGTDGESVSCR